MSVGSGTELPDSLVAELPSATWLSVQGPDAQSFLQAQFTNDIECLSDGQCQLSAWCSPKGRVLCVMRVVRFGAEQFALRMPAALAEQLAKRMRMYVLRLKVTIEHASWTSWGVRLSEHDLASAPLPLELGVISSDSHGFAYAVEGEPRRHEVVCTDLPQSASFIANRYPDATVCEEHQWTLLDVRARVPYVDERTTDHFVPQMIALDALGAVSFTKGCYPGQEIVARTEYRGTLKRHLAVLSGSTDVIGPLKPAPGSKVYEQPGDSQAKGELVSTALSGDRIEMLGVLRNDSPYEGTVTITREGEQLVVDTRS